MQKRNLMGVGFSGGQVQNMRSCDSGLTAVGTTQANGLQLKADVNEMTTVASSTGVILPGNTSPGDEIKIYNIGAQTLSVYAPVGETINALSSATAYSVATASVGVFTKVNATRFAGVTSAVI